MQYTTVACPRCYTGLVRNLPSHKVPEVLGAEYAMCPKCLTLVKTESNIRKRIADYNSMSDNEKRKAFLLSRTRSTVGAISAIIFGLLLTYITFNRVDGFGAKLIFGVIALLFLFSGIYSLKNPQNQSAWETDTRDSLNENKYIIKYWEYHMQADKEYLKRLNLHSWEEFFELEKKTLKNITDKLKYSPLNWRVQELANVLAKKQGKELELKYTS